MGGPARRPAVRPHALLAADCGRGVGLGHLERMLALADALHTDLDVDVVLPRGDPALRTRVVDRGYTPLEATGSTAERVAAAVGEAAGVDVVVLDGYVFDVELQRRLRACAPLTVIDDLRLPVDCDLAVNPSPGGERMRPAGATTFVGGARFALIRSSFVEARDLVSRRGLARRTVLVSTGATDLDGIGARVSIDLLDGDETVAVIRVVGPDMHDAGIRELARERLLFAPASLAEALSEATIYAGAAGTTAVQAACVGIPAVITAAVPNQEAQAAALAAAGCALVVAAADVTGTCLALLDDQARCAEMTACGRALVDGHGANRVAEAVRDLIAARAA